MHEVWWWPIYSRVVLPALLRNWPVATLYFIGLNSFKFITIFSSIHLLPTYLYNCFCRNLPFIFHRQNNLLTATYCSIPHLSLLHLQYYSHDSFLQKLLPFFQSIFSLAPSDRSMMSISTKQMMRLMFDLAYDRG